MFFLCVFALGVDMVYFAGVLLVALGFGRRKHTEGHTGPFQMPRLFLSNPFPGFLDRPKLTHSPAPESSLNCRIEK